jgi:hypothetical protein
MQIFLNKNYRNVRQMFVRIFPFFLSSPPPLNGFSSPHHGDKISEFFCIAAEFCEQGLFDKFKRGKPHSRQVKQR